MLVQERTIRTISPSSIELSLPNDLCDIIDNSLDLANVVYAKW